MTPGFLKGRDPDHSIVIYIFYIPIGTFSMSVVFNGEFAVIFCYYIPAGICCYSSNFSR